jgi:hypothetical protein
VGAVRASGFARARIVAVLGLAIAGQAAAGPPFLTDDPVPVEVHHWEAYLFWEGDAAPDVRQMSGPAVEFNWGAAPNLQLHLVAPFAFTSVEGGPSTHGLGDVEVGVKYRFVEEDDRTPTVGVFPMLELPTGDADRGLGNGKVWARLPLWVQKSWGPWTTYGGGGYVFNRAPDALSYLFAGWLVQRDLSASLTLGGEVYTRQADTVGGGATAVVNAGGYYNITRDFSLLFSAGHSFSGESHAVAYLGLYWTWGGGSSAARPDAGFDPRAAPTLLRR